MMVEGLSEGDRLVARLLAAFHAEKGLTALNLKGLCAFFASLHDRLGSTGLPETEEQLEDCLARLASLRFVGIDRRNPHVKVEFQGLVSCGLLPIPSEFLPVIKDVLEGADLR